jgi:hypothetical protein
MSIVDSFTKPVHASYVYGCALHAERGSQGEAKTTMPTTALHSPSTFHLRFNNLIVT